MQEKRKSAERDWQTFLSIKRPAWTNRHSFAAATSFVREKEIRPAGSRFAGSRFFFRHSQMNDCAPQRFGTNQDQLDCIEHLPRGFAISRACSYRRSHRRRETKQSTVSSTSESTAGDGRRSGQSKCATGERRSCSKMPCNARSSLSEICHGTSRNCLNQKRRKKCVAGFGNYVNWLKRIAPGLFALLRNHHGPASFQGCDLPINMQTSLASEMSRNNKR